MNHCTPKLGYGTIDNSIHQLINSVRLSGRYVNQYRLYRFLLGSVFVDGFEQFAGRSPITLHTLTYP